MLQRVTGSVKDRAEQEKSNAVGTAFKKTLPDTTAHHAVHHVVNDAAAELDSVPIDNELSEKS